MPMTRPIALLLALLLGTAASFAEAACGAGTVLYFKADGRTWLLLADHQHWLQRDRGWAAFGGLCADESPEAAAARETEEETRGYFRREQILPLLEASPRLRTSDYTTWFVEVGFVPAVRVSNHSPPSADGAYYERGPFAWVPLSEVWSAIDAGRPRALLPTQYLPGKRRTDWLYGAFVRALLTARQRGLLPEG